MITLFTDTLRFTQQGGTIQVPFESGSIITQSRCTVDYYPDRWVSAVTITASQLSGQIAITVLPNAGEDRSGYIDVTLYDADDKGQQFTIDINQEGEAVEGTFEIQPSSLDVDKYENAIEVTFLKQLITDVVVTQKPENVDVTLKNDGATVVVPENTGAEIVTYNIQFTATTTIGTSISRTFVVRLNGSSSIIVENESIEVSYDQLTVTDNIILNNISSVVVTSNTASSFCTARISMEGSELAVLQLTFLYNMTNFKRDGVITLTATTTLGEEIVKEVTVLQNANATYLEFPIWKDTMLSLPASPISYRIINEYGDIVYSGRSYGDSFYINRVLQSQISSEIDLDLTINPNIGLMEDNGSYRTFKVQIEIGEGNYSDLYIVRTYYDYSYDIFANQILSKPIQYVLDRRQNFLFTIFNSYKDGPQAFVYMDPGRTPYFIELDKGVFTYINNTFIGDEVIVGHNRAELRYKVVDTCSKYCLYYLNTYGGWDSLLFDGKCVQSASNDINTFDAEYDNGTIDFGTTAYLKQKTDKWKLTTKYLTDEQAKMMPLLLDSTKVYLHDLENNTIIPVVINTESYEIKSYRSNNKKLFTYTIDVTNSQLKNIR